MCRRSLEQVKLRNQIPTLVDADILGPLIEKFLDNSINLGPEPVIDTDGTNACPASTIMRWGR